MFCAVAMVNNIDCALAVLYQTKKESLASVSL